MNFLNLTDTSMSLDAVKLELARYCSTPWNQVGNIELLPLVLLTLPADAITPSTDKAAAPWSEGQVPGSLLLLWHLHHHLADRRIQLQLRELLQHTVHQEGG